MTWCRETHSCRATGDGSGERCRWLVRERLEPGITTRSGGIRGSECMWDNGGAVAAMWASAAMGTGSR
jgi:hypothetical protein